jgi:hypothetical protein
LIRYCKRNEKKGINMVTKSEIEKIVKDYGSDGKDTEELKFKSQF